MSTCQISGNLHDLTGQPVVRPVRFVRSSGVVSQGGVSVVPLDVEVMPDAAGQLEVNLYPTSYVVTIDGARGPELNGAWHVTSARHRLGQVK